MKQKSGEEWLALRSRVQAQLTPLEAAMTPAQLPRQYGTLSHVKRAFEFEDVGARRKARQRQKIWVR